MAVVAVRAAGSMIVTGTMIVQLLASLTVKLYKPATRPVCVGVIVYGLTPPVGVISTEPFDAPLQFTSVTTSLIIIAVGWVIVTGKIMEQLLASVTVNMYAP